MSHAAGHSLSGACSTIVFCFLVVGEGAASSVCFSTAIVSCFGCEEQKKNEAEAIKDLLQKSFWRTGDPYAHGIRQSFDELSKLDYGLL